MTQALVVVWLACSVASYGFDVAYFQRKYPLVAFEDRIKDRVIAAIMSSLAGPIALIVILFMGHYRKGWML